MTNLETTTTDEAANAAEQGAPVAPETASSKKNARRKNGGPTSQKEATQSATPFDDPQPAARTKPRKTQSQGTGTETAKNRKVAKSEAKHPQREGGNKKAQVVALLRRAKGATLQEITDLTGWQAHTVRGFISLLGSKGGIKIASSRRESDGVRVYTVNK